MPKKKIISQEPLRPRPHRNMKAKVVFDPSDNHIPKKRAKYSYKNEKPVEASTVKKTTNDRTRVQRKKRVATKSKILPVTDLDGLSTENNTKSPTVSPTNSPVKCVSPEVTQEISKNCFICLTISENTDLIDCATCPMRVHRQCLLVNEPLWKFKLDLCPWFCTQCKKHNCSKCLGDESRSKIDLRCITCEVGLHLVCYQSYEIKPLHKLENDMYVCIPCMTLATQINPEEVVEAVEPVEPVKQFETIRVNMEDDVESHNSSIVTISSDEYDTDSKSNRSDSCSSDDEKNDAHQNNGIPNIIKWNKDQVIEYLTDLLPKEIIDQIIKYDLDGRALQLLQRNHIVSNMGLKLGHAMKFYKQVRILQSQSTFNRLFWE